MAVLGEEHGGAVVEQGGWRGSRWLFGGRGFSGGGNGGGGSGGRKEGGEGDVGGRRGGDGAVVVAGRGSGRERREGRRRRRGEEEGGGGHRGGSGLVGVVRRSEVVGVVVLEGGREGIEGGLGREEWGRDRGRVVHEL
nr:keratin, type II cytoskeletal 2 epidermal-like [Arachis hypogaea]